MVYFSSCSTLTHWGTALMIISQSGHGSTVSSSGKCWSNTKATFSDIHHIIVSASCLDHTLTSTWPQWFVFPALLPTKLSFQWLFSNSLAVRDVPNPPQLYFWLATCWQNSGKPSLIGKHVRTCGISFLQNRTCQLWSVGVSLKRKWKIFKLFKSPVYPQQMCADTPEQLPSSVRCAHIWLKSSNASRPQWLLCLWRSWPSGTSISKLGWLIVTCYGELVGVSSVGLFGKTKSKSYWKPFF